MGQHGGPARFFWLMLVVIAAAELAGMASGKGLVESSRKPSNRTYSPAQLGDLGVTILTKANAPESGRCPEGSEEITAYGCSQGHARIWTSKLCKGAEDAWGSKCQKECGAWALEQGNRSLVPVAKQARCYVPEANEGDENSATAKCPATRFDKQGGKCRCWICLVRLEQ